MQQRDEQSKADIRQQMLQISRLAEGRYPNRWVPASLFLAAADANSVSVQGEAEGAALLNDLLQWGLLEEFGAIDNAGANARAFRHRRFRRTTKAHKLWLGEIDPIPGISDERFGD